MKTIIETKTKKVPFIKMAWMVVLGIGLFLLGGCATGYAMAMRSEHNETGKYCELYNWIDEYPSCFPATKMATMVEVPTWIVRSVYDDVGWTTPVMFPLGLVFTVADIGISLCTDIVMLPYDLYKVITEEEKKTKKGGEEQ